jgi:hypothetical protein
MKGTNETAPWRGFIFGGWTFFVANLCPPCKSAYANQEAIRTWPRPSNPGPALPFTRLPLMVILRAP